MQENIRNLINSIIAVSISVFIVLALTKAAENLLPPAAPNPAVGTMKTLEDIYQKLVSGTEADAHTLNPDASPAGTMYTLEDIYSKIPTNDKILYGTNAGTANTPPGSGTVATATEINLGYYAFRGDGTVIEGTAGVPIYENYPLTWSEDQGMITWYEAKTACATIGKRLPTISELAATLRAQFMGGSEPVGNLIANVPYWSNNEQSVNAAWGVAYSSLDGILSTDVWGKPMAAHTHCVH